MLFLQCLPFSPKRCCFLLIKEYSWIKFMFQLQRNDTFLSANSEVREETSHFLKKIPTANSCK